ncbi:MAG: NAD(P)H-dependent oxidoreductase subunit E [Candidatus Bathyarchaeia archaeon]
MSPREQQSNGGEDLQQQVSRDVDVAFIEEVINNVIESNGRSRKTLILILQKIQNRLGYLPKWSLELVSNNLKVPLSSIYGVATFYHQFNMEPPGENIIQICMGTACHIKGNSENYNFLLNLLNINPGENTSKDRLFTVFKVRCLGCCSLAPVIKVNDEIYGEVDFKKLRRIISKYRTKTKGESYGEI